MLNEVNDALQFTRALVRAPASVPVLGFVPIATVMFPVNPVAVLLLASRAVTCTAGVIAAPPTVFVGCTENTSWVAVPAVMLNALLVWLVRQLVFSVQPTNTEIGRAHV